jgi:hypothetical protein
MVGLKASEGSGWSSGTATIAASGFQRNLNLKCLLHRRFNPTPREAHFGRRSTHDEQRYAKH